MFDENLEEDDTRSLESDDAEELKAIPEID
jgi:hypothetical protein